MKIMSLARLALALTLPWVSLSTAQDATPPPPKEPGKDVSKDLMGYWIVDFDSAATNALTHGSKNESLSKEMAASTFEFKDGHMTMHDEKTSSTTKIIIKSQDAETGIIIADFQTQNGVTTSMTLTLANDRITMNGKVDETTDVSFGLKRIEKDQFEKRVPEARRNPKPLPDPDVKERKKEEPVSEGGFPIAEAVPDKPGFVFSPYNRKVLDVTDVPSGTLVADPHYDPEEKKYFRVP